MPRAVDEPGSPGEFGDQVRRPDLEQGLGFLQAGEGVAT